MSETSSHDPGSELSDRVDRGEGHDDQPAARAAGETEHGEDQQGFRAGGVGRSSEKHSLAFSRELAGETGTRSKRGGGVSRSLPHQDRAHRVEAGGSLSTLLEGEVYEQKEPALRIRVVGQAPIAATIYELERLRCNRCGDVFEAEAPEGTGKKKYDESAAAMIGLLKYGSGIPFYRLEGLEENLGIPLPASTQWEIVAESAGLIRPAFEALIRQAAQGEVLYNDDTAMKILALARASPRSAQGEEETSSSRERTGQFTSGVVSTRQGQRIALFFTGRKHAGENLARVLMHRAAGLGAPIQMCDALLRNPPGKLETLVGNCLAHGGATLRR